MKKMERGFTLIVDTLYSRISHSFFGLRKERLRKCGREIKVSRSQRVMDETSTNQTPVSSEKVLDSFKQVKEDHTERLK